MRHLQCCTATNCPGRSGSVQESIQHCRPKFTVGRIKVLNPWLAAQRWLWVAGRKSEKPCRSDICAGIQSLFLPHTKQVVQFRYQLPSARHSTTAANSSRGNRSLWTGGWSHLATLQLPASFVASSLSPDGKCLAALRRKAGDAHTLSSIVTAALVHVELAAQSSPPIFRLDLCMD